MAKIVRFPLEMEQGVEVRSMEELKENFLLSRVLVYLLNGKLVTWLRHRYASDVADAIEELDLEDEELAKKVCQIFEVEYDESIIIDLEKSEERNKKLAILKEYTTEQQFLDVVDMVAFTQDDLYDLLDEEETTIYLCGIKFSIPLSKKGMTYIGVNNPIVVIDSKKIVDWEEKEISLVDVGYDSVYQQITVAHQKQKDERAVTTRSENDKYKNSYLNFMLSANDKEGAKNYYDKLSNQINELNYDIETDVKAVKQKLLKDGLAGLADYYLSNLQ